MNITDRKERLLERVETALEMPTGVLTAAPRVEFSGNRRVLVEGCKRILECDEDCVRLCTANGVLRFTGRGLCMTCRTAEYAVITGRFSAVEFL